MKKNKPFKLDYYFYSYGNEKAAHRISSILARKDFRAFMKMFRSRKNGVAYLLPEEAFLREDGTSAGQTRNITLKNNFDRIRYYEYEHG